MNGPRENKATEGSSHFNIADLVDARLQRGADENETSDIEKELQQLREALKQRGLDTQLDILLLRKYLQGKVKIKMEWDPPLPVYDQTAMIPIEERANFFYGKIGANIGELRKLNFRMPTTAIAYVGMITTIIFALCGLPDLCTNPDTMASLKQTSEVVGGTALLAMVASILHKIKQKIRERKYFSAEIPEKTKKLYRLLEKAFQLYTTLQTEAQSKDENSPALQEELRIYLEQALQLAQGNEPIIPGYELGEPGEIFELQEETGELVRREVGDLKSK